MNPAEMSDQSPDQTSAPDSGLYRAFWRWHFYAGLLVLPVLMLMALTGGIYLFKDEINGALYRPLMQVKDRPALTAPEAWVMSAEGALDGHAVQMKVPAGPVQSVELVVATDSGKRLSAFVDPHDGRFLGSIPEGGVMSTLKQLHSLALLGPIPNLLVEVVAGWSIVLVATGVFLWWPRGKGGGVISVRGGAHQRVFWRDLHAVTGAFAGAIILFLAVTGMPWSAFWGKEVRAVTTQAGWGRPSAPASASAGHEAHEAKAPSGAMPWALQDMNMPGMSGMHMHTPPASVGAIVSAADNAGLPRPYVLSFPAKPGAAWSAAYMPDKVEATRTLYLDGASARVIADIGYPRFGPAAKAIEWGISVHQGQQFGRTNQVLMLAGCIAIWLLGISAVVMWWKRRPKGRLAAPAPPANKGAYWGLAAVVVPLALLYPLVGASLILVLGIDLLIRSARRRLRPA